MESDHLTMLSLMSWHMKQDFKDEQYFNTKKQAIHNCKKKYCKQPRYPLRGEWKNYDLAIQEYYLVI